MVFREGLIAVLHGSRGNESGQDDQIGQKGRKDRRNNRISHPDFCTAGSDHMPPNQSEYYAKPFRLPSQVSRFKRPPTYGIRSSREVCVSKIPRAGIAAAVTRALPCAREIHFACGAGYRQNR